MQNIETLINTPDRLFNISAAAKYTGKPLIYIADMAYRNVLKSYLINGKMVFTKTDIDEFMQKEKEKEVAS